MGQFVVHTADMIQFEEQQKANVAREKTMLPYSNWRVRDVAMGKSHTHASKALSNIFLHLDSRENSDNNLSTLANSITHPPYWLCGRHFANRLIISPAYVREGVSVPHVPDPKACHWNLMPSWKAGAGLLWLQAERSAMSVYCPHPAISISRWPHTWRKNFLPSSLSNPMDVCPPSKLDNNASCWFSKQQSDDGRSRLACVGHPPRAAFCTAEKTWTFDSSPPLLALCCPHAKKQQ